MSVFQEFSGFYENNANEEAYTVSHNFLYREGCMLTYKKSKNGVNESSIFRLRMTYKIMANREVQGMIV